MKLNAESIIDFVSKVDWQEHESIRLFWVKIAEDSRTKISDEIKSLSASELIIPIVLREALFLDANSVLSDFSKLLEGNRDCFEKIEMGTHRRFTIVLLLKDNFKLAQISSPVHLPRWFPILGGIETFLKISDLLLKAEVGLLHCAEANVEQLAVALYDLESQFLRRLLEVEKMKSGAVRSLLDTLNPGANGGSTENILKSFETHLGSVIDPTAYRPNSQKKSSILSILLGQILKSNPDQLASIASKLSLAMDDQCEEILKPTIFAIMLRPSNKISNVIRNWHSMIIAVFQAYQLMNAAAHAGEYPLYPVSLIHSNSRDLVRFFGEAGIYISAISND